MKRVQKGVPSSCCLLATCCSIEEVRNFLLTARGRDTKSVKIKKNKDHVKVGVGCSGALYMVGVTDRGKAEKRGSPDLGLQLKPPVPLI